MSSCVGLRTYSSLIYPTRQPPIGPRNGNPEIVSAEKPYYRNDIWVVFHIVGKNCTNYLRFIAKTFCEQGSNRPIYKARYKCFFLCWSPLALEEPTWYLSCKQKSFLGSLPLVEKNLCRVLHSSLQRQYIEPSFLPSSLIRLHQPVLLSYPSLK